MTCFMIQRVRSMRFFIKQALNLVMKLIYRVQETLMKSHLRLTDMLPRHLLQLPHCGFMQMMELNTQEAMWLVTICQEPCSTPVMPL